MIYYSKGSGYKTNGYAILGYASPNDGYQIGRTVWRKTTCCGSKRYGQQCTDCPS